MGQRVQNRSIYLAVGVLLLLVTALVLYSEAEAQNRTLYWGSRGADVTRVQQRLSQWGYYRGSIDGIYGQLTFNAVQAFQRKNGLPVTGTVAERTWAALGLAAAPARQPAAPVTRGTPARPVSDSVNLLARVIEGEAADEPYIGKVAVGAVIMNRVRSPAFPKTLSGVIYQPHAFESVTNGQYNRPLSQDSIRAAQAALNGWDPSGGALFFWNPAKPVSPWIWSRNIINRIGRHVFGL
ncbi:MAG: spore cortex-lytic enzyme [Bacillota bacterium]